MKTLAISDLHGKSFADIYYKLDSIYKDIDNIVQIGDWFDSVSNEYSNSYQIGNFKQMMKIRAKDSRVHILIGNHDASYLLSGEALYGIHCFGAEDYIKELIEENIQLIDYCYSDGKIPF